jgi:hypothetical protein
MMNAEDCLRAAWAAILCGDYEERDRLCALASNLIHARERIEASGDIKDIVVGEQISLDTPK